MAGEKRAGTSDSSSATAAVHDESAKAASALMMQQSPAAESGGSMTPKSSKTSTAKLRDEHDGGNAVRQQQAATAGNLNLQTVVGDFLETIEVQLAIVFLIALDVCCTALEMHLHDRQELVKLQGIIDASDATASTQASLMSPSLLLTVATRLVESFTGFTLFFFLIEMAVLVAAFRKLFFTHLGYVLDLVVVMGAIAYEIYAQSKALRLLGVLRIWRVFRLVNTLLDREKRVHDSTRDVLEQEQLKALQLATEKTAAEQSLKREYESRDGLEKLLQGYKDEVETLKEALNIAAEAVAEASMRDDAFAAQQFAPVAEESGTEFAKSAAAEFSEDAYYHEYKQQVAYEYDGYTYAAAEQDESALGGLSEEPLEVDEQREAEIATEAPSEALLQERESHGEVEGFEDANEQ